MMIILTQGFATGFIKNRSSRGDTEIILGSGQNWFYILIIYRFKFNRYIYIYKKSYGPGNSLAMVGARSG